MAKHQETQTYHQEGHQTKTSDARRNLHRLSTSKKSQTIQKTAGEKSKRRRAASRQAESCQNTERQKSSSRLGETLQAIATSPGYKASQEATKAPITELPDSREIAHTGK